MKSSSDHARRVAAREMDARHEVARHELCCAMARLCSPRIRGRKRIYIEIATEYRGVKVEIKGPELDSFDLGVLLAIYALAAKDVTDRDTCESRALLADDPKRSGQPNAAAAMDSLRVRTNVAEVAEIVGRDGRDGDARKRIRESIARLMSFTVAGTRGETWGATHLIERAADALGQLTIDLDYRATRAVLGEGQWAAISMQRWRECRAPLDRVLLHRIAALTTGRPIQVSLDTLAAGCWADEPHGDHDLRWRRQQVRSSIVSGIAVPDGFTALIDARGIVTFKCKSPGKRKFLRHPRSLGHAA